MNRLSPSWVVVLAGVSAGLHVGKLAPALPALQAALDISLLQAGFLLSLVQLAGMSLGLVAGLAADAMGLKRTMVIGLLVVSVAGAAGAQMHDVQGLLISRALEGLGFLMAVMPGPGLLRRTVLPGRLQPALGLWGTYMPLATALALLMGPFTITGLGWQGWWWLVSGLSAGMALAVGVSVAPDLVPFPAAGSAGTAGWTRRLRLTLSSRGPWLVALSFATYSGQWLAVIGFLPSIYAQAGLEGSMVAVATALVAAVNMVGNIASGRLLQRGIVPQRLLYAGFAAMGVGSFFTFAPIWPVSAWGVPGQYAGVLLFSMVGGLVPGTLFSLAVRLAPDEGTVSTSVGWMQQWSALGQFAGPPVVAWVATRAGGWHWSWVATGACTVIGLGLAQRVGSLLSKQRRV